jgi:phosphoglycolate phosphatase
MAAFDAFLFDLDGTLVDTAPDLGYALNCLREQEGLPLIAHPQIRAVASHGAAGLLKLGFDISPDHDDFPALQKRFLRLYQDNITRESRLFSGFEQVLDSLENQGIAWGVITNKPAFLTEPLLAGLKLSDRAACIVSGDTTAHSKPHPAPMLHACSVIAIEPERCLYVGDAQRDIEAGNNVNMHTIVAKFGYLSDTDQPDLWQADAFINQPEDLLKWI